MINRSKKVLISVSSSVSYLGLCNLLDMYIPKHASVHLVTTNYTHDATVLRYAIEHGHQIDVYNYIGFNYFVNQHAHLPKDIVAFVGIKQYVNRRWVSLMEELYKRSSVKLNVMEWM